jgi:hypothetical protein
VRPLAARAVGAGSVLCLLLLPACTGANLHEPTCTGKDRSALILSAQAVPSATLVPCIAAFPSGWTYDGSRIRSGEVQFWLDSDRAGLRAVEVSLTRTCDVADAVEVTAGTTEPGVRTFERPISLPPRYQADRYQVFPGGCVTYQFRFGAGVAATLALEADQALSFLPRSVLVRQVREDSGLTLCGANAPPCPG